MKNCFTSFISHLKTFLSFILLFVTVIAIAQIPDVITLPGPPPEHVDELTHLRTGIVSGATTGGEDVIIDYYVDSEQNIIYIVYTSGDGTQNDGPFGMSSTLAIPNMSSIYWTMDGYEFKIQTSAGEKWAKSYLYYDTIDGLQDQSTPKLSISVGADHITSITFDQLSDHLIGNHHPAAGFWYNVQTSWTEGEDPSEYSTPTILITDIDNNGVINIDDIEQIFVNESLVVGNVYVTPSSFVGHPIDPSITETEDPWTINQILSNEEFTALATGDKAYVSLMIDHDGDASTPMVETFDRVEIEKGSTLSTVETDNKTGFQLYPNPVINTFTVLNGNSVVHADELIGVFNTKGQVVAKGFEADHLASGVYYVVIQPKSTNEKITLKLIKK